MIASNDDPTTPLLAYLKAQLTQISNIDLVNKVYASDDQQTLVVELHLNPAMGLRYRNILFFPVEGFQLEQVYKAITRLKDSSKPPGAGTSGQATHAHSRRLRL